MLRYVMSECTSNCNYLYKYSSNTAKKMEYEKDKKKGTKEGAKTDSNEKEKEKERGEGRERGKDKDKHADHFESRKYLNLPDRERILGQLAGKKYVRTSISLHTYGH